MVPRRCLDSLLRLMVKGKAPFGRWRLNSTRSWVRSMGLLLPSREQLEIAAEPRGAAFQKPSLRTPITSAPLSLVTAPRKLRVEAARPCRCLGVDGVTARLETQPLLGVPERVMDVHFASSANATSFDLGSALTVSLFGTRPSPPLGTRSSVGLPVDAHPRAFCVLDGEHSPAPAASRGGARCGGPPGEDGERSRPGVSVREPSGIRSPWKACSPLASSTPGRLTHLELALHHDAGLGTGWSFPEQAAISHPSSSYA